MKYRKKPVVIEATQFKASDPSTHEHVNFSYPCGEVLSRRPINDDSVKGKYWVQTLEGPLIVSDGDYIITGVKGEHYPCRPDIFEMTYERVE